MNGTLEECSTVSIPSWKIEYEKAILAGVPAEELLDKLEESFKFVECSLVWEHTELEDITSVETLAKQSIDYDEKRAYLQNIIDSKCRKTM